MPIVRLLLLAHLSVSAALLLVLVGVLLCQRLARAARPAAATTLLPAAAPRLADPSSAPVLVPAQEAAPGDASHPASVLEWSIDLRTETRLAVRPTPVPAPS